MEEIKYLGFPTLLLAELIYVTHFIYTYKSEKINWR